MYNLTKTEVLIGIGSNLRGHMSNPKNNLKIVFKYLLRNGLRVVKFSKIYINRPHPGGLGPLFCNSVVLKKRFVCCVLIAIDVFFAMFSLPLSFACLPSCVLMSTCCM